MPELPDLQVYLGALEKRVLGRRLERLRVHHVFLLRTAVPPVDDVVGRRVTGLRRLGKRLCFGFEHGRWLVLHLMVAGRLQWADGAAKPAARNVLAEFGFETGTLVLTEAGTKRRAALHVAADEAALATHDPGGLEPLAATAEEFAARLRLRNHTLKRALTDPTLFSGIGNAYSDEILHAARLSPVTLTQKLADADVARLFAAVQATLTAWTTRLRRETGDGFPAKVTAFRPEMAVHGKFGQPCPECGTDVQRIVYAENEVNYCPRCQTGGRLLADRSLSRLLKSDWPRTIEEAETRRGNS